MDLAGTAKDEEKELFKGGAIRELFKEDALRELFEGDDLRDFCFAFHNLGCCNSDHDKCQCFGIATCYRTFFFGGSFGLLRKKIAEL